MQQDKRIALVTGANRGIGLEICRQLLQKGCFVILTGRNESALNAETSKLDPIGENTFPLLMDVSNAESISRAFKEVQKKITCLDILINNAGVLSKNTSISSGSEDEFREVMETNFYGPYRIIRMFLPLLRKSRDARIINMSSGMGALSELNGSYAGYRMSKAGLNALTIMFANDLRHAGITVNAACPGWVQTDMGGQHAPDRIEAGADTAVWLATVARAERGHFYRNRKIISW